MDECGFSGCLGCGFVCLILYLLVCCFDFGSMTLCGISVLVFCVLYFSLMFGMFALMVGCVGFCLLLWVLFTLRFEFCYLVWISLVF